MSLLEDMSTVTTFRARGDARELLEVLGGVSEAREVLDAESDARAVLDAVSVGSEAAGAAPPLRTSSSDRRVVVNMIEVALKGRSRRRRAAPRTSTTLRTGRTKLAMNSELIGVKKLQIARRLSQAAVTNCHLGAFGAEASGMWYAGDPRAE
jgi:hypothetical protein